MNAGENFKADYLKIQVIENEEKIKTDHLRLLRCSPLLNIFQNVLKNQFQTNIDHSVYIEAEYCPSINLIVN